LIWLLETAVAAAISAGVGPEVLDEGAGGGEASIVSSGGNRQRGKPTAAASTHPDCSSTVGNVWLTLVSYPFL